jgi:cell division protein FtsB
MSARAQAARGYRPRPAPRRSARNPSRIRWDKLGRVALVLVLMAILASYINPVVDFFDAWSDSRAERAQLQQLQQQNQDLRARAAALSGPDAAEREARRLGMVAPGERSYVIK